MNENYKKFLSPQELKELFGFGLDWQAKARTDRKIPFLKIGRFVRYDREEIEKWMLKHKVSTIN